MIRLDKCYFLSKKKILQYILYTYCITYGNKLYNILRNKGEHLLSSKPFLSLIIYDNHGN